MASTLLLLGALGCTTPNEGVATNRISGGSFVQNSNGPDVGPDPTTWEQAQGIYIKALDVFTARDYERAYLEFQRVLVVEPRFYEAHYKMGLCRYYQQKFDDEIACYERCLEIKSNYPECLVSLGNAYLAQDELEKAVKIYKRILRQDGNHPVALFNLGLIYFDLQDNAQSAEFLERFIRACPNDRYRAKAEVILKRARAKLEAASRERETQH